VAQVDFEDLQVIDYKKAWDYQETLFNTIIEKKKNYHPNDPSSRNEKNYLLFCEHPHVYTLGINGAVNNMLINDDFLKTINATYYKINRGGDITYHGPGQIVGYPIFDLDIFKLGIKDYIHQLEQAVINTLADYGVAATRLDGATGVWLDVDGGNTRKICAIGVRASRYTTMHGFAFNVNTDLNYFNFINPCGFVDKGVTSLEKELGAKQDFEEVKAKLLQHLKLLFGF